MEGRKQQHKKKVTIPLWRQLHLLKIPCRKTTGKKGICGRKSVRKRGKNAFWSRDLHEGREEKKKKRKGMHSIPR